MSCGAFNITKREGERRLQPVTFLSDYGTFVIDYVEVIAYDADGNDVTDDIIDEYQTSFADDTAQFMMIGGEAGQQYTILVSAHSPTTELPIAKVLLAVTD